MKKILSLCLVVILCTGIYTNAAFAGKSSLDVCPKKDMIDYCLNSKIDHQLREITKTNHISTTKKTLIALTIPTLTLGCLAADVLYLIYISWWMNNRSIRNIIDTIDFNPEVKKYFIGALLTAIPVYLGEIIYDEYTYDSKLIVPEDRKSYLEFFKLSKFDLNISNEGNEVTASFSVLDDKGNPITNYKIKVYVNNNHISNIITDKNGTANYIFDASMPGNYIIEGRLIQIINLDGNRLYREIGSEINGVYIDYKDMTTTNHNETYMPETKKSETYNATVNFNETVNTNNKYMGSNTSKTDKLYGIVKTKIITTSTIKGNTITYTASLLDNKNKPLANQNIELLINNGKVINLKTDKNGKATYTLNTKKIGKYKAIVNYKEKTIGNNKYQKSTTTKTDEIKDPKKNKGNVKKLQKFLKNKKCYAGKIDGIYGKKVKNAEKNCKTKGYVYRG